MHCSQAFVEGPAKAGQNGAAGPVAGKSMGLYYLFDGTKLRGLQLLPRKDSPDDKAIGPQY